jgi:atypical dual specificity phosphatase
LRTARPRSLESEQQEAFVSQWVSHRWKLLNAVTVSEPVTLLRDSDFQGARIDPANLDGVVLVMIGKPGSGKSWLSECIARRRPSGRTIIISQDECGSRSMCETELARDHPATTLVILDRCNPSREDRMYWLKLTDRRTIAIFFDYDKEVCRHRIDKRLNHPTIRAGKGGNALDQMDKEMKPPTLAERYSSILRISSFTAAREAVLRFTPPVLLRKFPRTPHLMNLGSTTEDDIVLDIFSPATGVLEGNLTIEEKIDGANMGISLGWDMGILTQNRSHWVHAASHAQFKPLDIWLDTHRQTLTNLLLRDEFYPERYILYGEWMVAKHTVHYRALPDRFIAFDMYDRLTSTFLSRSYLEKMLKGTGIQQVPLLASVDGISKKEILDMIQGKSAFGDGRMEGVYVRFEDPERKFTLTRGKVVRGDFIAGNDHWSKGRMVWNELKREYGGREGGEGAQAGEV